MTVAQVTEIVMLRLSNAMEEGTIGEWLKQAGDVVRAREPIVDLPEGTHPDEVGPSRAAREPGGLGGRARPMARRLAEALGVDLANVQPSGRRGQIMKSDVEAAAGNGQTAARTDADGRSGLKHEVDAKGALERVELSRLQQTVASRMAPSHAVVPDFALEVEIDMRDHPRVNGAYRDDGVDFYERINVHRILYGANASRFLTDVRDRLEAPLSPVV